MSSRIVSTSAPVIFPFPPQNPEGGINPDLTRAEAQLAFQRREARRQRRLRSTAPRPQDSHGSPSAHRVMLSADANAFVPLGASNSSPPVQRDVNSI